ncbi:hypothetical protein B0T16DRAFT_495463 [Cercophora newfieldiana]|uniref:Cellulase n=1 Tax=Cercophora newfieldiana TaxID=92897 RepID=A0AA39XUN3_9PEZI|nr:hypothetical protein B0T16DRAFT_495463 [Cercophora newfieldiana]
MSLSPQKQLPSATIMLLPLFASVLPLLITPAHAVAGKSYTTWDCCKPACGDSSSSGAYNKQTMIGAPRICNINNDPFSIAAGLTEKPACGQSGMSTHTHTPCNSINRL